MIRTKKAGFTLIEVMMGMVIASFALTVLLSYLQHLIMITQKSAFQGNEILHTSSSSSAALLGIEEKHESDKKKPISLELVGNNSSLKDFGVTLKRVMRDKRTIQLVFVPPVSKKEASKET